MRKELKKINGERTKFVATVDRFGIKKNWHGYYENTICLKDVKFVETNKLATDHIWFTVGKRIKALNLKENDKVMFDARVSKYVKGYFLEYQTIDYKLNNPTKFKICE
ncbi:MAG: hypothetical protein ACOC33_00080 [bacterium]